MAGKRRETRYCLKIRLGSKHHWIELSTFWIELNQIRSGPKFDLDRISSLNRVGLRLLMGAIAIGLEFNLLDLDPVKQVGFRLLSSEATTGRVRHNESS